MRSIMGMLTYGHRLQVAEGSVHVPLDRADLETWVTKSEQRHERLSGNEEKKNKQRTLKPIDKGEDAMTVKETPNGECHDRKYFCFKPPVTPNSTTIHWFQSCCCEDGVGNAVDALLAFVLARKAANPQIVAARKILSPNGACHAVEIQWQFGSGGPSGQSNIDLIDILLYYIALLAAL